MKFFTEVQMKGSLLGLLVAMGLAAVLFATVAILVAGGVFAEEGRRFALKAFWLGGVYAIVMFLIINFTPLPEEMRKIWGEDEEEEEVIMGDAENPIEQAFLIVLAPLILFGLCIKQFFSLFRRKNRLEEKNEN